MGKKRRKNIMKNMSTTNKALIFLAFAMVAALIVWGVVHINTNRECKADNAEIADTIAAIEEDIIYKYGLPIEDFNVTYS